MEHEELKQMFARVSIAARVRTSLVIVRGAQRNAWTDGDKVYVTTSLIESLPEDQVAAAVAHELGHIIGRHVPDTEKDLEELRARIYSDRKSEGFFSRALIEGSIVVARQYRSRRHEFEADSIGDTLTKRAGYGSGKMSETLNEIASEHQNPTVLDSHPTTPERLSKLQDQPRKIRIRIIRKT